MCRKGTRAHPRCRRARQAHGMVRHGVAPDRHLTVTDDHSVDEPAMKRRCRPWKACRRVQVRSLRALHKEAGPASREAGVTYKPAQSDPIRPVRPVRPCTVRMRPNRLIGLWEPYVPARPSSAVALPAREPYDRDGVAVGWPAWRRTVCFSPPGSQRRCSAIRRCSATVVSSEPNVTVRRVNAGHCREISGSNL